MEEDLHFLLEVKEEVFLCSLFFPSHLSFNLVNLEMQVLKNVRG